MSDKFMEPQEQPVVIEKLSDYIEEAKATASDLRYPEECLKRLDICKSTIEVNNVLASYRRRIK